jgi:hypothetical protein
LLTSVQVQQPERQTSPLAVLQETKPSEKAVTLIELVQRARNSAGQEQVWLATLVNQRLKKIAALPEPETVTAWLLEQLEEEGLSGLTDKRGWPVRAAVVEAIIEFGYPFALELRPEDVEFLTEEKKKRPTRLWPLTIASGLGLTASVALGLLGVASTRTTGVDVVTAGLTATGFLGLLLTHPRGGARRALEVGGLLGSVLLGGSALVGGTALFHSVDAMLALALASFSSVVLSFIEGQLQPK